MAKKVTEKKEVKKISSKVLMISGGTFLLLVLSFTSGLLGAYVYEKMERESGVGGESTVIVKEIESNVINVVQQASESVVSIAISRVSYEVGEGLVDQSSNIGTGFIVSENGLIITNQHVVDANGKYKVVTSDGEEFEVQEILRDDTNDIALLKIDTDGLKPLELGDSDNLTVGQTVIAIGTPLGSYAGSVTTGVVSGLERSVSTGTSDWNAVKEFEDVIQTDAAVNPGNSGGPLLDTDGKVIGVNFATTAGADNISFALPINRVVSRLEEYRKYGKFLRPYLGVEYQMISERAASYYGDLVAGALVVRVVPDSPASNGGLQKGDIITYMGEDKVESSLVSQIQKRDVDEEVEVKVYRDGEEIALTITLAEAD